MSNNGWPDGVGRIVLSEVDSTLTHAARISPDLAGPTWILALRQTAGRGRRGRAWVDPVGNFAATYAMRPAGGPELAALRSFIAALALYDAIVAVTGRSTGLTLKWPNDVLLNGGKLAGILLESVGDGPLSVGIGVNLLNVPDAVEEGAVRPVSLLSETGAQVTPEEFLDALAPAFARYEAQFTTYGFAPIRTAWLDRAARLGEVITARTGTEEHVGTFETVDETGALILRTSIGRRVIPAGEVYF
ncbi:MAG: biotin--[acetyl-CoA-carboxylase] ligase [Marinosulfonomonas sp.]|nr:MAG: biotin--[acetyl-CoA-carboxylase] ligase [Marinosulfonomonas sp.]